MSRPQHLFGRTGERHVPVGAPSIERSTAGADSRRDPGGVRTAHAGTASHTSTYSASGPKVRSAPWESLAEAYSGQARVGDRRCRSARSGGHDVLQPVHQPGRVLLVFRLEQNAAQYADVVTVDGDVRVPTGERLAGHRQRRQEHGILGLHARFQYTCRGVVHFGRCAGVAVEIGDDVDLGVPRSPDCRLVAGEHLAAVPHHADLAVVRADDLLWLQEAQFLGG